MTDNEIIKAWEFCTKRKTIADCIGCPYRNIENCLDTMLKDSFELYNRQKAKIKILSFQLAEANLSRDLLKMIDKELFANIFKQIINKQKAEISLPNEDFVFSIKLNGLFLPSRDCEVKLINELDEKAEGAENNG